MARIRSRGNKDTELALARLLHAHGITGWRRQLQVRIAERGMRNRGLGRKPGNSLRTSHSALRIFTVRPDFVFRKQRTVIFVDGCFWHGCPRHATKPKQNAAFWRKKLAANRARDLRVNRRLRQAGWRVIRIWECALAARPAHCLRRIRTALAGE